MIGLYPIVDSSEWVSRLVNLGVDTIQLRIKDASVAHINDEIARSVTAANDKQLFINDHWQLAIEHGAFGVHLGQEDLDTADFTAIKQAGLNVGISTHNDKEIARALAHDPFYLAYGPIFATTTKTMAWEPRGLEKLQHVCKQVTLPVVAIGGIDANRLADVLSTGVAGVAMISAITRAPNSDELVSDMLKAFTNQGKSC